MPSSAPPPEPVFFGVHDRLAMPVARRAFDEALEREWRRGRREQQPLSLVLFDIDRFKDLNDRRGHPEGDRCLRRVARCLTDQARRAGDLVARFGGDEFAVLLAGQAADPARWVAERLRSQVEALALPHPGAPAPLAVLTVSAGVATGLPADGLRQPRRRLAPGRPRIV